MQTILGSTGAIGTSLANELTNFTDDIRLVSRNPKLINPGDELISANLLSAEETLHAIDGSEIVYLVVGLDYNSKTWQEQWPVIMENVIVACTTHKAKLVFFDNIYMYDGSNLNLITESLPINPPSKKGAVRAEILSMLWDAHKRGDIQAVVARAADFYGPDMQKPLSFLIEGVVKPLKKGNTANWLANDSFKHSFTYIPDAAKATAVLGNTPDSYGRAWHLPTAPNPFTGKEWVEHIAKELKVKPKYRVATRNMIRFLGLFMPVMKESVEMLYQYEQDYVFNSDDFEKTFGLKPTPYEVGIKEILK